MSNTNNTPKIMGFGYVDDTDKSLQTQSRGQFGLNSGVYLKKFEINDKAGAGGAEQNALDIEFEIGGGDQRLRFYPTEKVYKDNVELTDKDSADYITAYNADWTQKAAVMTHIVKCFRPDEDVKRALSAGTASFVDYVNIIAGLLPDNFQSVALDLFLEWQWAIPKSKTQTYLQIPKNMKGGAFVVAHVPAQGQWEASTDEDGGLVYVDSKTGNKHPFHKNKEFMESAKGYQQKDGEEQNNAALQTQAGTGGAGAAKPKGW